MSRFEISNLKSAPGHCSGSDLGSTNDACEAHLVLQLNLTLLSLGQNKLIRTESTQNKSIISHPESAKRLPGNEVDVAANDLVALGLLG